MPRVAIIYKTIPQYRRDFFNQLRTVLEERNVELRLLYGQPSRRDALKNDTIDLDWAERVPSRIWQHGRYDIYWQPVLSHLKDVDLVIVEQASKLLVNYILWLQQQWGARKLAFWGHGRNFQERTSNPLAEWLKRRMSRRVHWWFAYNELSAEVVNQMGFPRERISVVQNAVDTRALTRTHQQLPPAVIERVRLELGLRSQHVGIYAGALYPEKGIPFLLDALRIIRQQVPDFEMIFIGAGVDAPLIKDAAARCPWIHFVGPRFDAEKVPYFAVAQLFLMPFSVGLGILDTFALETPLITTAAAGHGPEIAYLTHGVNGLIVDDHATPLPYANAVSSVLQEDPRRQRLVVGCRLAKECYTVENMVDRFAAGVMSALKAG